MSFDPLPYERRSEPRIPLNLPPIAEALFSLNHPKPKPKRLRDRNRKRAGQLRARGWHRAKNRTV